MSLGASLMAGKLPNLERIGPITLSLEWFLLMWRTPVKVYEQGNETWQYCFKEVLPSRPMLSPFEENHTIEPPHGGFTLTDLLVDFSELDKYRQYGHLHPGHLPRDFQEFDYGFCNALITQAIKSMY